MADTNQERQPWSPWGLAFQELNYVQLPHGVTRILRRCGYKHAEVAVVIEIMTHVRRGDGGTEVRFSYGEVADNVRCSRPTVGKAVARMLDNHLTLSDDGAPKRMASVYELSGFLNWLAVQKKDQEKRDGR